MKPIGNSLFHIDRGGDITFHGPGQLVCYPNLDLECLGIGLRDYIGALDVVPTPSRYPASPPAAWQAPRGSGSAPESAGETGTGQPPAAEITAAATATSAVTAATKASAAKAATAAKTATRQEPAIAAESAIAKSASVTAHSERCRARGAPRDRRPVVTLYHHARAFAECHDRPRVVHAHQPLRVYRPGSRPRSNGKRVARPRWAK